MGFYCTFKTVTSPHNCFLSAKLKDWPEWVHNCSDKHNHGFNECSKMLWLRTEFQICTWLSNTHDNMQHVIMQSHITLRHLEWLKATKILLIVHVSIVLSRQIQLQKFSKEKSENKILHFAFISQFFLQHSDQLIHWK